MQKPCHKEIYKYVIARTLTFFHFLAHLGNKFHAWLIAQQDGQELVELVAVMLKHWFDGEEQTRSECRGIKVLDVAKSICC